jgi:hypothetical protein
MSIGYRHHSYNSKITVYKMSVIVLQTLCSFTDSLNLFPCSLSSTSLKLPITIPYIQLTHYYCTCPKHCLRVDGLRRSISRLRAPHEVTPLESMLSLPPLKSTGRRLPSSRVHGMVPDAIGRRRTPRRSRQDRLFLKQTGVHLFCLDSKNPVMQTQNSVSLLLEIGNQG